VTRRPRLDDREPNPQNSGTDHPDRSDDPQADSAEAFMSAPTLLPVDRPDLSPLPISARLRSQLVYFMTPAGSPGLPELQDNEYWIARDEVTKWLDDGVFYLVSPLDSANFTEVELTEEQESLLSWLRANDIQHVRVRD
jgi:hypothetical protein